MSRVSGRGEHGDMKNCFVHPSALVETTTIGKGTRIWAFAHVMPDVRIGENCNIGDHAFIESGVCIGNGVTVKNNVLLWRGVRVADYVMLGPNVVFTNDLYPRSPRLPLVKDRYGNEKKWLVPTFVEEGVSIGANATILAGVRLGRYCMIGAGCVVTRDVLPFQLVGGNPARPMGRVDKRGCVLKKHGGLWVNPESGVKYRLRGNELAEVKR